MAEDEMAGHDIQTKISDAERQELAASIDALMALPPRERPAITVVGDDNVFGIYPITPAR